MIKKRKKRATIQHGLFKIFGFVINLNTIVTTVLGSICCAGVGAGLLYVRALFVTFETMERDVPKLERELHRLQIQYPPLAAPKFEASVNAAPTPHGQ